MCDSDWSEVTTRIIDPVEPTVEQTTRGPAETTPGESISIPSHNKTRCMRCYWKIYCILEKLLILMKMKSKFHSWKLKKVFSNGPEGKTGFGWQIRCHLLNQATGSDRKIPAYVQSWCQWLKHNPGSFQWSSINWPLVAAKIYLIAFVSVYPAFLSSRLMMIPDMCWYKMCKEIMFLPWDETLGNNRKF